MEIKRSSCHSPHFAYSLTRNVTRSQPGRRSLGDSSRLHLRPRAVRVFGCFEIITQLIIRRVGRRRCCDQLPKLDRVGLVPPYLRRSADLGLFLLTPRPHHSLRIFDLGIRSLPVGRHKHMTMITLQSEIHRRSGVWVPTSDLWAKLGELYDLEALDAMVRPPSPSTSSSLRATHSSIPYLSGLLQWAWLIPAVFLVLLHLPPTLTPPALPAARHLALPPVLSIPALGDLLLARPTVQGQDQTSRLEVRCRAQLGPFPSGFRPPA